jgi:putative SOS response-associated peptidase YedK
MCGRYTLGLEAEELVEAFDVPELAFEYRPRFNIAPGQEAPVVAVDRRGRRMGLLRWGLVPAWMNDPGRGFINARAESVLDKPSFRDAFLHRRCLVPADGFYEWKKEGRVKTPHWIHPTAGGLVSFAGIWERWDRPGVESRHTFAIITNDANEDVRRIHDRMPVFVVESDHERWLDRATDEEELHSMLRRTPPAGTFSSHVVSTRVNRAVDDDPGLIEPA